MVVVFAVCYAELLLYASGLSLPDAHLWANLLGLALLAISVDPPPPPPPTPPRLPVREPIRYVKEFVMHASTLLPQSPAATAFTYARAVLIDPESTPHQQLASLVLLVALNEPLACAIWDRLTLIQRVTARVLADGEALAQTLE
jgi:hypothetical protein